MGLNGGGYTFIDPQDIPGLTNDEIQAMFTDKTSFLGRRRNEDSTQSYSVIRQLPSNKSVIKQSESWSWTQWLSFI